MSLTGYKSYNNSNLQGNNTTDQHIATIESDLDVVEEKVALIKSVKDYGALGDGVTDDSVALQNCLNTYGRIWFPEGVYLTSKSLIVYPNTHIYGDGRGKSILKAVTVGSDTGSNLFNCHMENISIRSMTIDGNRDNITGAGGSCIRGNLSTSGAYNCLFEDLELKNSDAYGMGFQVNTIKNVIINNCFLENLGNDGIDFKNYNDSNEAVIFSNIIVKDPCMKSTNTNKAAIDLRGCCLLSNVCILFENTTQPCDGIRFRDGVDASPTGRGAWRCSLSNFYVKAYSGYNTRFGVNILNENVNVCNGTIVNFGTGIRTHLEANYCKVSNVFATNCNIGFQDNNIENKFTNCEARDCSSYGFYLNGCSKSSLIGCISYENDYGFYNNASTLTSLINCNANNNTTGNYNSFTGAEINSCLDGTSYLTNEFNSGISATSFTGDGSALININATQIADGSVSNTEFQYINSLSSNAQTQLDNKLNLSGGTMTGNINLNSNDITNVDNIQLTTINGSAYPPSSSYTTGSINPRLKATGSSGSTSYTNESGKYIKIGDTIHFTIDLQLSSKSGMSGDLYIDISTDLSGYTPDTSVTTRFPVSVGHYDGISNNKICSLTAYIDSSKHIYMLASEFNAASSSFSTALLTQGNVNSSFYITLQGYFFI